MPTNKTILSVITIASLFAFSCSRNEPLAQSPKNLAIADTLSEAGVEILESIPDTNVKLEDVILSNGQNAKDYINQKFPGFLQELRSGRTAKAASDLPSVQLDNLKSKLSAAAFFLTDDANWLIQDEGTNKPAQPNGLAYLPGGKNPLNRLCASVGDCKTLLTYGADCSGMLYYVTTKSGMREVVSRDLFGVVNLMDVSKWSAALKTSSEYSDLKAIDLGQLPRNLIQDGDVIIWYGKTDELHIGISFRNSILQSYGRSKHGPIRRKNGTLAPGCETNHTDPDRGPRKLPLNDSWLREFSGGIYRVIRFVTDNACGTISDIDGNNYETARIGDQCWFKENLRTTKFRNGEPIPSGLSNAQWSITTQPAMSYPYDIPSNTALFGNRYNWYAVSDPRGLCPQGWHVSSYHDWNKLSVFLGASKLDTTYLGERGHAQSILNKVVNSDLWNPNFSAPFLSPALNETGLTLTPGRFRNSDGSLADNPGRPDGSASSNPYAERLIYTGAVWTSTLSGQVDLQTNDVIPINIEYYPYNLGDNKQGITASALVRGRAGMACRCVKD